MRKIICFTVASTLMVLLLPALPAGETGGWLRVKAKPSGAGVFIDGQYVGPAANFFSIRRYPLEPGRHTVRIADAAHQDSPHTVESGPGQTTTLSVVLTPLVAPHGPFGKLQVYHPDKFAAVSVDGRFVGFIDQVDNPFEWILLAPGEHVLTVTPSKGGATQERRFILGAKESLKIRLQI